MAPLGSAAPLHAAGAYLIVRDNKPSRPIVQGTAMDVPRGDHSGCADRQRTDAPYIDALAEAGILFDQSISQSSCTHI